MDAETRKNIEARIKGGDTAAFDRWRDSPEIKLLISMLPPGETDLQKDCLPGFIPVSAPC